MSENSLARSEYRRGPAPDNFPNRSWSKNGKGGIKVTPYTVKRKRHDGIRCYGSHVGSKCRKYDFSIHPPFVQAQYRKVT